MVVAADVVVVVSVAVVVRSEDCERRRRSSPLNSKRERNSLAAIVEALPFPLKCLITGTRIPTAAANISTDSNTTFTERITCVFESTVWRRRRIKRE
jgi:hypothetical protein